MAKTIKLNQTFAVLLFFVLVINFPYGSKARILHDFYSSSIGAMEPAIEIVFSARENGAASPIQAAGVKGSDEETKKIVEKQVLDVDANKKLGEKFGLTVMSMLPKGGVPASGPSRRINKINN